jgi:parallel beta-helix repeat protein
MCGDGIGIEDSSDIMVLSNMLTNNGLTGGGDTYGLWIYYCTDISVTENVITGNLYGMYVQYSDHVIVNDNVVNNNMWDGAEFYNSDYLMIEGNSFNENGDDGAYLWYCDNVIFGNNTANENADDGVYIYGGDSITIYNGEYAENTWYGLDVDPNYGADWIVDATAEVRNNEVYIDGDVSVVSGGVLTLDAVFDFTMGYDDRDGMAEINVAEGGTLIVMNSVITYNYDTYEFKVLGTLDMESSTVEGAMELYLGPTSDANIRTSTIYDNYRNGINIEDCSPVISGTTIYSNGMDGIFIEGANAAPKITDCLISGNCRGIYAYKSSLANVVDNLIVLNDIAGIYAYDSDGKIHDNVLLFNQREIWIKDSTVSVVSNQIGYSVLIEVMAKYLPLLSMNLEVPIISGVTISPELMVMMMLNHIGIYAENSTVSASDNVYGMLTYAVYVVDSQLTFNDKVVASELTIPYFDSNGVLWNITVPIHVYDGIYASGSSVTVNGGYIEVLDDAIFLEASTADLRNVVLNATDVDLYLMDGSTASATEVTFDGKIIVEDSSVLTVNYKLTVIAIDQDGQPVGGVWIVVSNAAKESVAEGATGDDGTFVTYVVGYVQTSAGKSAAMNPYLVNASFDQGSVLKSVTVDGPTEVTVQVPVKKVKPIDMAPIIAIVLIGIVLVAMLLLVVRGRL